MSFEVSFLFTLSIVPGVILGWIRFQKMDSAFYPFVVLLTAGFANELLSYMLIKKGYSNEANYNVYSLMEVLIIVWQFYRWGLFNDNVRLFKGIVAFCAGVWTFENLIYHSLFTVGSYSIILHSFTIVIMSIHMINRMIFKEVTSFLRHSVFLICIAFIIYFTYAILVEMFLLFGLEMSRSFREGIYDILDFINLFTNLIYALAILWMPKKPQFIIRY